ncbi:hypothetical protein Glove_564g55 [Diversispora epigaea]|uniref:HNH domain-containing protein n=1 Tax=Diversispora epigaea TaxID=1348612 RepID=A0A397GA87_9GLOM|nr:hypothetical protein Glove_564g55 [Diversispora epigaea]
MKRMPTKSKQVYENWKIYSLENELMFRCNSKKALWYLSRNLATQISEDSIQLNFIPKGLGHHFQHDDDDDNYFLEDKMNYCVCCGNNENSTLHHVVPNMYRKYMPEVIKSHASHDILLMCIKCHLTYETFATEFKKQISQKFNFPLGQAQIRLDYNAKVRKAASALLKEFNNMKDIVDDHDNKEEKENEEKEKNKESKVINNNNNNYNHNHNNYSNNNNNNNNNRKRNQNKIPDKRIQELKKIVLEWYNYQNIQINDVEHDNENNNNDEDNDKNILDPKFFNSILQKAIELPEYQRNPEFIEHGKFVINSLMKEYYYIKISLETGEQEIFNNEVDNNNIDNNYKIWKLKKRWPLLENFIKNWRSHFLNYAKPKYLSNNWKIDNSIYIEQ